jgi:hypothetical protein
MSKTTSELPSEHAATELVLCGTGQFDAEALNTSKLGPPWFAVSSIRPMLVARPLSVPMKVDPGPAFCGAQWSRSVELVG